MADCQYCPAVAKECKAGANIGVGLVPECAGGFVHKQTLHLECPQQGAGENWGATSTPLWRATCATANTRRLGHICKKTCPRHGGESRLRRFDISCFLTMTAVARQCEHASLKLGHWLRGY